MPKRKIKRIQSPPLGKTLEIMNYKSLKHVQIQTSRINIFVGRPNSGKSNLLEAITLFNFIQDSGERQYQPTTIRYNSLDNFFYDRNLSNDVFVRFGENFLVFSYYAGANVFMQLINPSRQFLNSKAHLFSQNLTVNEMQQKVAFLPPNVEEGKYNSKVGLFNMEANSISRTELINKENPLRHYVFQERSSYSDLFAGYLKTYGENLYTIVQNSPELRNWINSFFDEYGLEFLIDFSSRKFEIQKKEKGIVYKIPFELTPDTFRRMLFHVAAIYSNRDATILFEEPESHSFPPYIKELSELIKQDENENEYFITTHSPYFFNSMVEDSEKIRDISFFHVYYENFETKIDKLSQSDLDTIWGSGADVFFNIDSLRK